MKTIKFKYLFIASAIISFGSCSEEFIEVQPKGVFLSENYYSNEQQCTSALVGVYDAMRKNSGGFENMITMMNAGSDDFYAGGGSSTDGEGIQTFSTHSLTPTGIPGSFWNDHYQGVFRANVLLSKLPQTVMADDVKARIAAEAKALRAIYYFNLVRMFKNIPLILEPLTTQTMYDVEQATSEATYAQIEKDLIEAIPALPGTIPSSDAGRITKGGAQAMLGKVYLFENKKPEAAAILAQVNGTPGAVNQYGNKLLASYKDLWVVSNKFNTESLIEVCHSSAGNTEWGWYASSRDEGNTMNLMIGPRNYSKTAGSPAPDLPSGWGFNIITQDLYDAMKTDPRFTATILDLNIYTTAGTAKYDPSYQNTGYFLSKFVPRASDVSQGGGNVELNYRQNTPIIRLADTYLMEAEALGSGARAQALLDAVRARVGLPSVPVTLQAIKNERRMEFAGEGLRFFDLVRWGDAPTVLANRGFNAGVDEIFPIPTRELQGTKLKQNPGYN
ncbi:RagB/SusD family nutrient uptake outer membrane protein [Flavobacterium sp.]|uniref:RagB/SusD family nutrient uptake outer membrane protein n=1 Tax=Flavobacterium sp. TaxID=239 RepID=UPI002C467049|nr:RagB/SusD family nutrient uptake outer membrane protein [Flavobacterium sp.]HSD06924.1 RagB/SusD family nutrient uptake outer membrane protein [Flavobacterium sp.]